MQLRGDVTRILVAVVEPGAHSGSGLRATENLGETKTMKQEDRVPSQTRSRRSRKLRRGGLWLSPTELLVCPVSLSLLLLQLLASSNAQVVIATDSASSPPFTIRCNLLDAAMEQARRSCGTQYPVLAMERITLTYSGTIRDMCNHSMYEITYELNRLLNYMDNTCPKNTDDNLDPYRLAPAIPLYNESYNRHCSPKANLQVTAFALTVNVKCSDQRATPRPTADVTASPKTSAGDQTVSTAFHSSSSFPVTPTTPTTALSTTAGMPMSTAKASTPIHTSPTITEPASTTTTPVQKTTTVPSYTSPMTVGKSTERSTAAQTNDSLTPPQNSNMVQILASVISVIAACSAVAAALGVCSRRQILCFAALRAKKGKSVACVSNAVSTNTAAQNEAIYAEIPESCIGQSTCLHRKHDEGFVRSVSNGGPRTLQSLPNCNSPSNEEPSSAMQANAHFTDRRQREDERTIDDRLTTYVSDRTASNCQPPAPPPSDGNKQIAYIELLPAEPLHHVSSASGVSCYASLAKHGGDHSYIALAYAKGMRAPSYY